MSEEKTASEKYVYVKDDKNNIFVCKLSDLKKPNELTEEEKKNCQQPPMDA